jgi:ketosteroid isomerase-like protein
MSQENVEAARKGAEAFISGDWELYTASLDPHVLLRLDPRWPEQRIYGREAAVNFARSARELMGSDARIEEIRDLGDRVLVRFYWETRGEHSGLESDLRWSQIGTMRDGRVILIEYFLDHDEALKAVGLEE